MGLESLRNKKSSTGVNPVQNNTVNNRVNEAVYNQQAAQPNMVQEQYAQEQYVQEQHNGTQNVQGQFGQDFNGNAFNGNVQGQFVNAQNVPNHVQPQNHVQTHNHVQPQNHVQTPNNGQTQYTQQPTMVEQVDVQEGYGDSVYGTQMNNFNNVQRPSTNVDSRFQHIEEGRVYDRKLSEVKSLEVHNISDFHYGNPDSFGLQVLGLNSSEKVKLIKPKALQVSPIEITNISDTTGRVSAKLMYIMDKTSATVLPLRECGVFEGITYVEGFKIVDIKGKKYASYCGSDYPTFYLNKLVEKIVDRITSAMPYGIEEDLEGMGGYIWKKEESRLSRVVTINGREIEIPSLCNSEIEFICARLSSYNCNIIDVANDFPHIIVGVDLEGVGFGEKEL